MITTPQYTIKELFEAFDSCENLLLDMNLNGVWPDPNPHWDPEFYYDGDDNSERTKIEAEKLIAFISKPWKLSDVKYDNEIVMVTLDESYRQMLIKHFDDQHIVIPSYLQKSTMMTVLGEIAQQKHHMILMHDFKIVPGSFHDFNLIIVPPSMA